MEPTYKDFVVAMSFKDYTKEKTGLPKVMLSHQQMYLAEGISYVGLFWVTKRKLRGKIRLYWEVGLLLDGEFQGVYQMSQIVNLFADWCSGGCRMLDIHIHHMMYTDQVQAGLLLSRFHDVPIKVYLHDYYNVCANFNLMKNGTDFCGGKGLCHENCAQCPDFKRSRLIQRKLHRFFRKYNNRIQYVSPSRITKQIFLNFHPEHADRTIVIPHQTFTQRYLGNLDPVAENGKIRVAYLGMPVYHKGWETWKRLVEAAPQDQYEFIVFNSVDKNYAGMEKVDIAFSEKDLNAMTTALRTKQVHVALMWSMCAETYSYTCFEAYGANAMLITRTDSGNMEDMVRQYNCGLVLSSEAELLSLFRDSAALRQQINDYRAKTPGGPENMTENRQIVEITKSGAPDGSTPYRKILRPVNCPLLYLLNRKYNRSV